ncbi:hypothetical protein PoB_003387700 [Plakobranchus ocellatus]|uniref:Uncharacterized protein n=1 Tax=Plakobranchus ocellatus TaxID=259542 RepID=A0AAV4AJE1_9GAST|nr:hypothetical protein PoB_003387700 [Plakobranchus ocellatus]
MNPVLALALHQFALAGDPDVVRSPPSIDGISALLPRVNQQTWMVLCGAELLLLSLIPSVAKGGLERRGRAEDYRQELS